jgi:hypothetical protein
MQCNSVKWPVIGKGVCVASKGLIQLLFVKGFTVFPSDHTTTTTTTTTTTAVAAAAATTTNNNDVSERLKKVTVPATRTHWLSAKIDFVSN